MEGGRAGYGPSNGLMLGRQVELEEAHSLEGVSLFRVNGWCSIEGFLGSGCIQKPLQFPRGLADGRILTFRLAERSSPGLASLWSRTGWSGSQQQYRFQPVGA